MLEAGHLDDYSLKPKKTNFVSKKDKATDKRISTCTDCNAGIFKNRDTSVWTSRGLVHDYCEEKRLNEIKEVT